VLETRRLTGDLVRALAVSQFDLEYRFPDKERAEEAVSYGTSIQQRYQPNRRFKQKLGGSVDSLQERTEATLMESGEQVSGAVVYDEERHDRKREREGRDVEQGILSERQELERGQQEEERRRQAIMAQQMSAEGAAVQVSGGRISHIVSMQAADIRRAAEEYAAAQQHGDGVSDGGDGNGQREEQEYERQVEMLTNKAKAEKGRIEQKQAGFIELETRVENLREEVARRRTYQERVVVETDKLDAMQAGAGNQDVLHRLQELVALNERLKQQEADFKTSCQQQRAALLSQLKELDTGENDEERARMREIETLHAGDSAKLSKSRQVLAKLNQEIAKVTRAIDDQPTRAELLQYERRFVELYELVQDKLGETRKYYEFYNTLNESYQYMSNEDKLLNSIVEGFPKAMQSTAKGKASFLASFTGILANIEQNKAHVSGELSHEHSMRDVLNQKHTRLLEQQRKYFQAVKEFQEECYRNEQLSDSLARLES
jgi:hypothetical protein